jgi:CheY-like chemotaxis protein
MEQDGFTVHEFNDPVKAWEYFQLNGKNCTVVLSDIRMPGMSGFEFCRKVKHLRPEAPVIFMTAFEINQSEFSKVLPHTTADAFIESIHQRNRVKDKILIRQACFCAYCMLIGAPILNTGTPIGHWDSDKLILTHPRIPSG